MVAGVSCVDWKEGEDGGGGEQEVWGSEDKGGGGRRREEQGGLGGVCHGRGVLPLLVLDLLRLCLLSEFFYTFLGMGWEWIVGKLGRNMGKLGSREHSKSTYSTV